MKKFLSIVLIMMLVVTALIGCSSQPAEEPADEPAEEPAEEPADEPANEEQSSDLQDGTYEATYSHMDSHGWRAFVELTVDGGEITDVTFDYVNPDGQLKTEDEGYAERMSQYSDNGMTPAQASEELHAGLVETQDPSAVDVVTGATHSSHNFQDLAAAAIENAKAGDTSTAVLPQNGTYTAEGELDDHGWKPVLEVTFENGEITDVMYDEFDEEENSKRADEDYNARLEEASGVTIEDAISQLETQLVEEQSIDGVDVVSGATSTSNKFKELFNNIMDQRIPFNEGASEDTSLEDGTYEATYSHMDSHGWRAFVELTVDGGEITDVTFDYVNPDGQLKTEDEGYAERMSQYSDNGMTPAQASEELQAGLIETQDPAAVDVVTGATHSAHNFQDLAAAAIENAKAGDTSTAVLPQNGTYSAEGELDDHGWKPVLEVTFENGEITDVMYDEFDEEENSKRADEDYNARLEEESGVTVEDAFSQLESRLLEEQSVESVDAVSGATSSSNKFKALAEDIMEQRIPFNE